ncbi:hypothetical protein LSAT2_008182 [Lamellibrachia satsuma]|nr:hypothetical protein LSAT2_008182 [Lamellibrachia satsuma]
MYPELLFPYLPDGHSLTVLCCHWLQLTSQHLYVKRDSIPETIQYGRLLKELQKEVKHLTVSSMPFRGPSGIYAHPEWGTW